MGTSQSRICDRLMAPFCTCAAQQLTKRHTQLKMAAVVVSRRLRAAAPSVVAQVAVRRTRLCAPRASRGDTGTHCSSLLTPRFPASPRLPPSAQRAAGCSVRAMSGKGENESMSNTGACRNGSPRAPPTGAQKRSRMPRGTLDPRCGSPPSNPTSLAFPPLLPPQTSPSTSWTSTPPQRRRPPLSSPSGCVAARPPFASAPSEARLLTRSAAPPPFPAAHRQERRARRAALRRGDQGKEL